MKNKRTATIIIFPGKPPEREEMVDEYSSHAILLAASWYIISDEWDKAHDLLEYFMEQPAAERWTWLPDELAALVDEVEDHFFEAYLGKKLEST